MQEQWGLTDVCTEALWSAWQYRYWSAERERDRNRHGTEGTVELGVEIVG